MVVLSKSSLNTFLVCPKLYQFLYVDKIRPPITKYAQRGIDFHQFCSDFYDYAFVTGSDMFIDKTWLEEQKTISTEMVWPFIENFLSFEEHRWQICVENKPDNPAYYFYPIMREKKLTNLGLEMVGIVDRVDHNFDNETYTVVDYKTEKYDMRSWKKTEHRREMAFYKKLLEMTSNVDGEITHFTIYYPRSNDVWCEKFSHRTISALERNMERVKTEIRAERFPCKVSYYCRYCDANKMCPMGGKF